MYRVLIVEDDPMVAMINEQYVKKNKQFTVVGTCQDGAAAVTKQTYLSWMCSCHKWTDLRHCVRSANGRFPWM